MLLRYYHSSGWICDKRLFCNGYLRKLSVLCSNFITGLYRDEVPFHFFVRPVKSSVSFPKIFDPRIIIKKLLVGV
jgi:hypothetical protein